MSRLELFFVLLAVFGALTMQSIVVFTWGNLGLLCIIVGVIGAIFFGLEQSKKGG